MKSIVPLLLLLSLAPTMVPAQHEVPLPRGMVVLKLEDGRLDAQEVYLLAVTPTQIAYKVRPWNADPMVLKMDEVDSLFLYNPADYLEALDLFEGREYEKARRAFIRVKEKYGKRFPGIPNNPGLMAGFYELECLRKLNDLEGLRIARHDFKSENLTHEVALQQLKLYDLWDAIRGMRNREALTLVASYAGVRLAGELRAQIAYCKGRAMEELNHSDHDILMAYQTAITADGGASEVITRDAMLRSLEILHNDREVRLAMRAFEMGEKIRGLTKAMEAAGLCSMYLLQFGDEEPLPAKYRHFLKFTPEKVQEHFEALQAAE